MVISNKKYHWFIMCSVEYFRLYSFISVHKSNFKFRNKNINIPSSNFLLLPQILSTSDMRNLKQNNHLGP